MYSVFLVEDEILIRDGIKQLIAWNEYGFNFVGEASDGELAWPLIEKQKPDIVITDIKMPFMDGLALSRLIKKQLPETTVIILSGYDDFSYAKEAISIGISQYLLKPLSKDQLINVLREVKIKKDKEAEENRHMLQFNSEVEEYLSSSRKGFFDALVSGKLSPQESIARSEKLQINLTAECYNIVLFLLEGDLLKDDYFAEMADVQADIQKNFIENKNFILFSVSMDLMAFLIMADSKDISEKTSECVNRITKLCTPIQKEMKWSIVISKPVNRLSALTDCYREARKELFHKNRDKDNSLYYVGDELVAHPALSEVDFNPNSMDADKLDQRIVEKFLTNGLPEDLPTFVIDYFNSIGAEAIPSMLFRQYVVLNIQFTVNAFLKKLGCSNNIIDESQTASLQNATLTIEGSLKYVQDILSNAIHLRDTVVTNRYSKILGKALDYMNANFANPDIDLNTVAKVANVSPTYFSAVFSHQMGKTFVEYLTELRMQKAKELLRCTDESSGEIALKIGYNDPHYFSFMFKKINGYTPRDYRFRRNSL